MSEKNGTGWRQIFNDLVIFSVPVIHIEGYDEEQRLCLKGFRFDDFLSLGDEIENSEVVI